MNDLELARSDAAAAKVRVLSCVSICIALGTLLSLAPMWHVGFRILLIVLLMCAAAGTAAESMRLGRKNRKVEDLRVGRG